MLGRNDGCGVQRQVVTVHVLRLVCAEQAGGRGLIAPAFVYLDGIALRNGIVVDSVYLDHQSLAGGLAILVGEGYADLERPVIVCIRTDPIAAGGFEPVVIAVTHCQGEVVGIDVAPPIGHIEIIEGNLPAGILVQHDGHHLLGDHRPLVGGNHVHGHCERLTDGLAVTHRQLYRQITLEILGGMDGILLQLVVITTLDDHAQLIRRAVGILDEQIGRGDGDRPILAGGDGSLCLDSGRIVHRLDVDTDILRLTIIDAVIGDVGEEIAMADDPVHLHGRRRLVTIVDIGEGPVRVEGEPILRRIERPLALHQPGGQLPVAAILIVAQNPLLIGQQLQRASLRDVVGIVRGPGRDIAAYPLVHPTTGRKQSGHGQQSERKETRHHVLVPFGCRYLVPSGVKFRAAGTDTLPCSSTRNILPASPEAVVCL